MHNLSRAGWSQVIWLSNWTWKIAEEFSYRWTFFFALSRSSRLASWRDRWGEECRKTVHTFRSYFYYFCASNVLIQKLSRETVAPVLCIFKPVLFYKFSPWHLFESLFSHGIDMRVKVIWILSVVSLYDFITIDREIIIGVDCH